MQSNERVWAREGMRSRRADWELVIEMLGLTARGPEGEGEDMLSRGRG